MGCGSKRYYGQDDGKRDEKTGDEASYHGVMSQA
jgi:hypothetical protein